MRMPLHVGSREAGFFRKLSLRTWLLGSVSGASLFFFLFQGGKLAFMLFMMMAVLNLYLSMGRWSGINLVRGTRLMGAEGPEANSYLGGTVLTVRMNLQIPGILPIPYVMVRERLVRQNGGVQEFESSFIPDWYRRGMVEYKTPPLGRGLYRFEKTECSTQDILGVYEHKGYLELPSTFTVWPRTIAVKEWPQLQRMYKGLHHHMASNSTNRETTQINGVREYNYGDRLSRIHWNATARTGTFKSKEFERESLPRMIIVLDRQQRSYSRVERFETAVSIAASLVEYGKKAGLSVGLVSVGSDASYLEPHPVGSDPRTMLHHLIQVEANGHHSLLRVLEDRIRQFPPGSSIVLVTPQRGEAVTQAMSLLKQRQLVPCYIGIAATREEANAACRPLQAMGFMGYAVRSLDELPDALGGAG